MSTSPAPNRSGSGSPATTQRELEEALAEHEAAVATVAAAQGLETNTGDTESDAADVESTEAAVGVIDFAHQNGAGDGQANGSEASSSGEDTEEEAKTAEKGVDLANGESGHNEVEESEETEEVGTDEDEEDSDEDEDAEEQKAANKARERYPEAIAYDGALAKAAPLQSTVSLAGKTLKVIVKVTAS